MPKGKILRARVPSVQVCILGLWQGAWKGKPDNLLEVSHDERSTVPVGIGVVIPAKFSIEVLELPILAERRLLKYQEVKFKVAASPDVAKPSIVRSRG